MAKKNASEVAKALAIVLVPIGAIIVIFYILYQWLTLSGLEKLWKKIYQDYLDELRKYAEEDQGNITPEHQTILDSKIKILQDVQASYLQAATSFWTNLSAFAEKFIIFTFAMLGLYFAPTIITKWKSLAKGKGGTAKSAEYIAICSMIDDLASKGQTVLASRLYTFYASYFNTVDAPFMQNEILRYQQIAQTATGWLYYYAQFIIQFYTLELVSIPLWFQALPPLPPI